MKLSFLPGNLHLIQNSQGEYVVTLRGDEVCRTPSEKVAVKRFNELRSSLAKEFPRTELSPEQKSAALKREIADGLVAHNSFRPQPKKRPRGSTRTFG
jgi:hypothetical protein